LLFFFTRNYKTKDRATAPARDRQQAPRTKVKKRARPLTAPPTEIARSAPPSKMQRSVPGGTAAACSSAGGGCAPIGGMTAPASPLAQGNELLKCAFLL